MHLALLATILGFVGFIPMDQTLCAKVLAIIEMIIYGLATYTECYGKI